MGSESGGGRETTAKRECDEAGQDDAAQEGQGDPEERHDRKFFEQGIFHRLILQQNAASLGFWSESPKPGGGRAP